MTGIETALIVGAIASAAVSAVGIAASGAAESRRLKFEQAVAADNARASRQQGAQDAEEQRREARRRLASIRAAFGSKGFTLEGTPIDVLEDQAAEFELAAQRESFAGEVRARGFDNDVIGSGIEQRAVRTSTTIGLIGQGVRGATSGAQLGFEAGIF